MSAVLVSTSLNSSKQANRKCLCFLVQAVYAIRIWGYSIHSLGLRPQPCISSNPSSSLYNLYVYVDLCKLMVCRPMGEFLYCTKLYFFPFAVWWSVLRSCYPWARVQIFQGRVWVIEEGVEENCWDQAEDGVAERWCWQTVRWARGEDGGMNSSMCLICYSWVEVTHTRLVLDGSDA